MKIRLSIVFLCQVAFAASWVGYTPFLMDVRHTYGLDLVQVALVMSVIPLAKSFAPFLAGCLSARLGLQRTFALGALLAGLAVLVPFAPSFPCLVALRFAFGVGGAVMAALAGALAMRHCDRDQLPFANGLNSVAVSVGMSAALMGLTPLLEGTDWQLALSLLGAASTVLALAWLRVGSGPWLPEKFPRLGGLLSRTTWVLAISLAGPLSLYLCLNTWLPTFCGDRAVGAGLMGVFNLSSIPAILLGGWVTARLGLRRPLLILGGLLTPVAALGLVLAPNPLWAGLLGLSTGYLAAFHTLGQELAGGRPERAAMLMGSVMSLAYLLSSGAPALVAWMGNLSAGLVLVALLSASPVLGGVLLPETGRSNWRLRLPARLALQRS
ncbi:MAG: MFS transporter [Candidatus Eremiobacterota bacterium]